MHSDVLGCEETGGGAVRAPDPLGTACERGGGRERVEAAGVRALRPNRRSTGRPVVRFLVKIVVMINQRATDQVAERLRPKAAASVRRVALSSIAANWSHLERRRPPPPGGPAERA